VVTHAAGRAQDRESSPIKDQRSATVLRHQRNPLYPEQCPGTVAGYFLINGIAFVFYFCATSTTGACEYNWSAQKE